jgi:hypothetical protein
MEIDPSFFNMVQSSTANCIGSETASDMSFENLVVGLRGEEFCILDILDVFFN